MDRSGDGADSADDLGSSQPYPSTLPGIPKVLSSKASGLLCLLMFDGLSVKLILSSMIGFYCYISFREVPDSCFSACKGQWKRILSSHILKKLYLLARNSNTGVIRYLCEF